jgi:RNA polymerase sigma-70 factor (ECF subfamily)
MPILSLNQPDPEPDDPAHEDAVLASFTSEDASFTSEDASFTSEDDASDRLAPGRLPSDPREPRSKRNSKRNTRDEQPEEPASRDAGRIHLNDDASPTAAPNSALASLDDNALLVRIQNGVEDALGALYDRYGKMLYSVSLRVLRDPTAAEDVLCDIFMDLWRNSETYLAIRGPLAGWLAVLARNRSIDALRRKRPSQSIEDILLAANFDLAQDQQRNTLTEKARSIVHALPSDQRKTLEMAFFDGLTHVEIAEMSGETEAVIRTRLRAALLTLRKALQA